MIAAKKRFQPIMLVEFLKKIKFTINYKKKKNKKGKEKKGKRKGKRKRKEREREREREREKEKEKEPQADQPQSDKPQHDSRKNPIDNTDFSKVRERVKNSIDNVTNPINGGYYLRILGAKNYEELAEIIWDIQSKENEGKKSESTDIIKKFIEALDLTEEEKNNLKDKIKNKEDLKYAVKIVNIRVEREKELKLAKEKLEKKLNEWGFLKEEDLIDLRYHLTNPYLTVDNFNGLYNIYQEENEKNKKIKIDEAKKEIEKFKFLTEEERNLDGKFKTVNNPSDIQAILEDANVKNVNNKKAKIKETLEEIDKKIKEVGEELKYLIDSEREQFEKTLEIYREDYPNRLNKLNDIGSIAEEKNNIIQEIDTVLAPNKEKIEKRKMEYKKSKQEEIDKIKITSKLKKEFKDKIDKENNKEKIDQIVEKAKQLAENLDGLSDSLKVGKDDKAKELQESKIRVKKLIDNLNAFDQEERDTLKGKVDKASSVEEVNEYYNSAKGVNSFREEKARINAKEEIDKIKITSKLKKEFKDKIDKENNKEKIDQIVEKAKQLAENLDGLSDSLKVGKDDKAKELQESKIRVKKLIDNLNAFDQEERDTLKGKVDKASSVEEVNEYYNSAKGVNSFREEKARINAKEEIDKIKITSKLKKEFKDKIDKENNKEKIDQIVEKAKQLAENLDGLSDSLKVGKDDKAKELQESKIRVKKLVDNLNAFDQEERDTLKGKIDKASSVEEVNEYYNSAKGVNSFREEKAKKDREQTLKEEIERDKQTEKKLEDKWQEEANKHKEEQDKKEKPNKPEPKDPEKNPEEPKKPEEKPAEPKQPENEPKEKEEKTKRSYSGYAADTGHKSNTFNSITTKHKIGTKSI